MRELLIVFIATLLSAQMAAQDTHKADLAEAATLTQILTFEDQQAVGPLAGWSGGPAGTTFADDGIVHSGKWAARLERNAESSGEFSTLHRAMPMDFAGKVVELRGFLRLDRVQGFAGLWMREDGESDSVAFDNMQRTQLKGTSDWTEYSITLPVQPLGRKLYFGVLLSGTGRVWADDLQLLVDGKPIWQAEKVERPKSVLDTDKKFAEGSGLTLPMLSPVQVENLVTLGKVWGFLKYHHPLVTAGKFHWDYELLRILPTAIRATDRAAANAAMLAWINALGPVNPCTQCATLKDENLNLGPDVKWIQDTTLLGADLSSELQSIYRNRPSGDRQFYVGLQPGVGNPVFEHELPYRALKFPDGGFQLLALYRFWNIVEYWSPYRNIVGEDWDKVLAEFIPKVALATNSEEYQRELMALIARMHDGHANLWSSLKARPPVGDCQLPVLVRFVEGEAVVAGLAAVETGKNSGLAVGDVITELDGVSVGALIERWNPYYASSNEVAQRRDMARSMTRGPCGEASVRLRRGSQDMQLKTKRVSMQVPAALAHDLAGETFRMLSKDVAYLKLSSVKAADVAGYVEGALGAKALIIDIRNYPSEFVVFGLGSLLVESQTEFARFTTVDPTNPGAFHWTPPLSLTPQKPHFGGRLVILVDEISQSAAEYTTMAFRATPGAVVVGSTTAGADGNVSPFPMPGGFNTMISGIGVFYPDKKPTQRIGIVPNVEVKPTIAGIAADRDEVLEEALRQVLGEKTPPQEIEKLAKPSQIPASALEP
jgi:C-terminal processing protease CtpA/Prc